MKGAMALVLACALLLPAADAGVVSLCYRLVVERRPDGQTLPNGQNRGIQIGLSGQAGIKCLELALSGIAEVGRKRERSHESTPAATNSKCRARGAAGAE
jgi:hypothetical protein